MTTPPEGITIPPEAVAQLEALGRRLDALQQEQAAILQSIATAGGEVVEESGSRLDIFHGYVGVLAVAFVVTLVTTPLMRKLAVANGIIDRPNDPRKVHRIPVAYLGGVAVFLGMMAAIAYSYVACQFPSLGLIEFHKSTKLLMGFVPAPVPISVLLGMTVIMLIGLIDDVVGIAPRLKVGGQLLAAAALAYEDVGVRVAQGVLAPTLGELLGNRDLVYQIPLGIDVPLFGSALTIDVIYWTGTVIIAVFVLGACNASNLIDGLDGLLTGTTAICAAGLLIVALTLALHDDGQRDAQRIVLCLALLGACLGFLPHNFNPATIFLGDCGSLLLGFTTIVIVLSLGDTGKTYLVIAGLFIYAIPIIDTVLAIVRRKLAGRRLSDPDSDHLHHMLKRSLGVKGAVLTLYGIGLAFAVLGVAMSLFRARLVYFIAALCAAYIVVTAIKLARRKQIEEEAVRLAARPSDGTTRAPAEGVTATTKME
ncbi:MAG: undecaprenyl/decaprenyl-phosphate alpha-N-acetylglucosaminyl 1-phosphate transferase [Phycisphaeraceae bacterium]|nr:undecaprenyl/decaprenyl-phosphate alpha-N-acetylglucosaminyl 1-phosphate transferase [Phycisphaeraceae bacterium]